MDAYYENQVAVVTGAGGTLCSAIAADLAKKGCKVALIGRTREKLEKTAAAICEAGGTSGIYPADVTDEAAMRDVSEAIGRELGVCRFLINGAGGNNKNAMTTYTRFDPAELCGTRPEGERGFFDLDIDAFRAVLLANTIGTVIPSRLFGREMAKAGRGAILNFASMNSYRPLTRVSAYAMSKAAVVNFTQFLAAYLAPAGIRVNAVAPGFFVNERSRAYLGTVEEGLTERGRSVISHTPAARFGKPEDLLGTVSYLLDDRACAFVTGITLPVDGGFLCFAGV